MTLNLIKTINDDDDVEDYSEESEEETNFQPSKQKNKQKADFDTDFQFISSVSEYNKDVWDDIKKYVKRKAKAKTDDKILEARKKSNLADEAKSDQNIDIDKSSDISLSDDELKHDNIKVKSKKKSKVKEEEEPFFDESEVPAYDESATFYQMNLSRPLLKAIGELKYVHPTPVQAATIPVALLGRDICGCAATGTGKTAAYMLPVLERLLYRPATGQAVTRVLVLVPTRELGVQVYQVTRQLAQFTTVEVGLAVGGLDLKVQETVLRKNPDVVIATPGRLIDHLKNTPSFSLDSIEVLILDEADRMLDQHFQEQMREIVRQCSRARQTLLFSATMTDAVEDLASLSLSRPVRIFTDNNRDVALNLRQEFIRIREGRESDREALLAALVCRTFHDHCMIFVQTKKQAHRLHIMLGLLGVKVGELHGNLTQPQRLESLKRFKEAFIDVLIATDVAARGLDISGVKTVVNFVMPATLEHYIHRVGRTARAGRAGISVSLAGEHERKIVKEVIKNARNPVKTRTIPTDIIEKYKTKLEKIEPEILHILEEEHAERLIAKAENQANRATKILEGENKNRSWFQTSKQRKEEKTRLALKPAQPKKANKKDPTSKKDTKKKENPKNKKKETPEDRVNLELEKVALLQAKMSKKKHKLKKIRSCPEENAKSVQKSNKRKRSNFAEDLFDVSKKGVKKMRYEANAAKKNKGKGKSNFKAKAKGKAFGKPKEKKSKF